MVSGSERSFLVSSVLVLWGPLRPQNVERRERKPTEEQSLALVVGGGEPTRTISQIRWSLEQSFFVRSFISCSPCFTCPVEPTGPTSPAIPLIYTVCTWFATSVLVLSTGVKITPASKKAEIERSRSGALYDLHTITGQSEGTHTHATKSGKKQKSRDGPYMYRERNCETGCGGMDVFQRVAESRRLHLVRRSVPQKTCKEREREGERDRERRVPGGSLGTVGMSMSSGSGHRRGPRSRTPAP